MHEVKKQLEPCSFLVISLSIIVILVRNYANDIFTPVGAR